MTVMRFKPLVGVMMMLAAGGLSGPAGAQYRPAPAPAGDAGMGEDARALTPAGPLQGNWRVVRWGDRADAAIMHLQIIHDGRSLEGSYVLLQPFCSIEQPLPVSGTDACEFIDLGGQFDRGGIRGKWADLYLRPGADGLDHRLTFSRKPSKGLLRGRYYGPGDKTGVPIVLERAPQ